MRPSSLMQWWGAAAKMVIFNINNKVLTIVFTGLVKEVGEHGVQLEIGISQPGEDQTCLSVSSIRGQGRTRREE